MAQPEHTETEPSIVASLGRAVEAGQRLVVDRIDLLKLDVVDLLTRSVHSGIFVVFGAVVICVGWLTLTWAAVVFGQRYVPLATSAALAGLANAVIGAGLVAFGVQRMRSDANGGVRSAAANGRGQR